MDLPGIAATIALALAAWLVIAAILAVTVGSTIRLRDTFRTVPPRPSPNESANRRPSFDSY